MLGYIAKAGLRHAGHGMGSVLFIHYVYISTITLVPVVASGRLVTKIINSYIPEQVQYNKYTVMNKI